MYHVGHGWTLAPDLHSVVLAWALALDFSALVSAGSTAWHEGDARWDPFGKAALVSLFVELKHIRLSVFDIATTRGVVIACTLVNYISLSAKTVKREHGTQTLWKTSYCG